MSYQINKNWSIKAEHYHDFTENVVLEQLLGINYRSDCWTFGIVYTNRLENWMDSLGNEGSFIGQEPVHDWDISFNIGIIGFGGDTSYLAGDNGNALGYTRPFFL